MRSKVHRNDPTPIAFEANMNVAASEEIYIYIERKRKRDRGRWTKNCNTTREEKSRYWTWQGEMRREINLFHLWNLLMCPSMAGCCFFYIFIGMKENNVQLLFLFIPYDKTVRYTFFLSYFLYNWFCSGVFLSLSLSFFFKMIVRAEHIHIYIQKYVCTWANVHELDWTKKRVYVHCVLRMASSIELIAASPTIKNQIRV